MKGRPGQIGIALVFIAASSAAAAGITTMTGASTDEAPAVDDGGTPAHAVEHKAAVEAYHQAVKAWTACVKEEASARGEAQGEERGRFDPKAACGDHPSPHDFAMTGRPDEPGKPDEPGRSGDHGRHEGAGKPDDVPRGPKPSTPPSP